MAAVVPGNSENYTIGGLRFYWTPDGGTELYFGNVVTGGFTSDITFLDHYTAKSGSRVKDRSVVQEIEVTISLTCDEPTVELMNYFMLGGDITAGTPDTFSPYTDLEKNGSGRLFGVSDTGNEFGWDFTDATLKPDGDFSYNDQDWSQFSFTCEVLADDTVPASPYGVLSHYGVGEDIDVSIPLPTN